MGREVIINADMIIVQGLKKYRGMMVNEDLFPKGHVDILLSKEQLTLSGVEYPNNRVILAYDNITVPELKSYLDDKNVSYPGTAKKTDLYELYKNTP